MQDKPGWQLYRAGNALTIKFGSLAGDDLIHLNTHLQSARQYSMSSAHQPTAKELKFGQLRLNEELLKALVPGKWKDDFLFEIILFNAETEKNEQGYKIHSGSGKVSIKVSE